MIGKELVELSLESDWWWWSQSSGSSSLEVPGLLSVSNIRLLSRAYIVGFCGFLPFVICAATLPRLEFHHHDIGVDVLALAIKVTAPGGPGNEDVARSIYLCQLYLGRKPTYLEICEFHPGV